MGLIDFCLEVRQKRFFWMTRWHWVCQGMSQPRSYKMITAICYLLGQLNVSAYVGIVISIGAQPEKKVQ